MLSACHALLAFSQHDVLLPCIGRAGFFDAAVAAWQTARHPFSGVAGQKEGVPMLWVAEAFESHVDKRHELRHKQQQALVQRASSPVKDCPGAPARPARPALLAFQPRVLQGRCSISGNTTTPQGGTHVQGGVQRGTAARRGARQRSRASKLQSSSCTRSCKLSGCWNCSSRSCAQRCGHIPARLPQSTWLHRSIGPRGQSTDPSDRCQSASIASNA